jgi:butyryl-CoA dehydrogenase
MDINFTEEQRMFQEMARDFAQKEIAPIAARIDEERAFPHETVNKMGELGFMGVAIPEEYGGAGADYLCYAIAVEEISRACASHGVIMSVNNSLVCDPLLAFGTEEQKQRYLVPLASGERLGCFALTEPNAGTDAGNQSTTAVKDGDEYILNGSKIFITNGSEADIAIIFAMTDKSLKTKGISAFILERGMAGFKVGKVEKKLGIRAAHTSELIFEDCRVPRENLLGLKEGQGFKIAMATLDGGRIGIAAQAVGIAQAALDNSITYSKQRTQFGQPIANFQAIQWMIADMATEIEAARLLTYRAAWTKDQGGRYAKEAAMAKLYASEIAVQCGVRSIQVHGGYGYMDEYPVQRLFRDSKITQIYEGTSEVQRMVIAASLLG